MQIFQYTKIEYKTFDVISNYKQGLVIAIATIYNKAVHRYLKIQNTFICQSYRLHIRQERYNLQSTLFVSI